MNATAEIQGQAGASTAEKVISSDSHVIEPWYLWRDRLPAEYKDRAPRLVQGEKTDLLVCEDLEMPPIGSAAGVFRKDSEVRQTGRWEEDVPSSAYDPAARMKELDVDGMWGEVLYPTLGLAFYGIDDLKFKNALLNAYNEWLAEFCAYDPTRYKGIAMIANEDPEMAADAIRHAAKLGLAGVMLPTVAGSDVPQYHERAFDPVWKAAVDCNLSVNIHCGTTRDQNKKSSIIQTKGRDPTRSMFKWDLAARPMFNMIFGGVFERFPDAIFVSAENEAGWAPHLLDRADYEWKRYANVEVVGFEGRIPKPPREYWRKNIRVNFMRDPVAVRTWDLVGAETLMFHTDFPHGVSTYPNSRAILDELFEGVPDTVRHQIVWQTAADLYGF